MRDARARLFAWVSQELTSSGVATRIEADRAIDRCEAHLHRSDAEAVVLGDGEGRANATVVTRLGQFGLVPIIDTYRDSTNDLWSMAFDEAKTIVGTA
jgi:hypothetical protein